MEAMIDVESIECLFGIIILILLLIIVVVRGFVNSRRELDQSHKVHVWTDRNGITYYQRYY